MRVSVRVVVALVIGLGVFSVRFQAQDRLAKMPGVEQFQKMRTALTGGAFVSGAITPTWADDAKSFTYTADNNVHPNNSMQLIKALQAAGKSFEVQVGPDAGHTGVNNARMMAFFIENLVLRPERLKGA